MNLTPTIDVDELEKRFGPLEFICAICKRDIRIEDFRAKQIMLMTGPKEHVAAHTLHFFTDNGTKKHEQYQGNMERLARVYAERNFGRPATPAP